jgi:DNA-binding response OmpR family regulator
MTSSAQPPALVVLDVMLPGIAGLDCAGGSARPRTCRIILLTARSRPNCRLELGADDYVTKPFSPRELAVRVRTVLRRSAALEPGATSDSSSALSSSTALRARFCGTVSACG